MVEMLEAGGVIVIVDDKTAAVGEQCCPRLQSSPNLVAREAADSGCWSLRLVLCCKETDAAAGWKTEVTAMDLSLVSEGQGQLPPIEGAKDSIWLHPCHPRLHLLVARLRSNTAAGGPDDCLFPSRSVLRELSSSLICYGQFSARSALRCYRPALSTTTG